MKNVKTMQKLPRMPRKDISIHKHLKNLVLQNNVMFLM